MLTRMQCNILVAKYNNGNISYIACNHNKRNVMATHRGHNQNLNTSNKSVGEIKLLKHIDHSLRHLFDCSLPSQKVKNAKNLNAEQQTKPKQNKIKFQNLRTCSKVSLPSLRCISNWTDPTVWAAPATMARFFTGCATRPFAIWIEVGAGCRTWWSSGSREVMQDVVRDGCRAAPVRECVGWGIGWETTKGRLRMRRMKHRSGVRLGWRVKWIEILGFVLC